MIDDNTQLDEMRTLDEELNEEVKRANGDPDKMLFILSKRLRLYDRVSAGLSNPLNKITLSNMKEGVANQMMIWKIKKDTDEQFAQITTRLDQLEQKVDRMHHESPS